MPEPKAFAYFETRPVLQEPDGVTCTSYTDEGEFQRARTALRAAGKPVDQFWSIYGVTMGGEASAIGDYKSKVDAQEVMHAILAPLHVALEILKGTRDPADKVDEATTTIEGFIDNCSTPERI